GGDVDAPELYSLKTGTFSGTTLDEGGGRRAPTADAPKNLASGAGASGATISTNKTKYALGETMIITGSGFTPTSSVSISVLRPDHVTDSLSAPTNSSGAFTASYTPPAIAGRYKITATDGTNNAITAA